MSRPGHLLLCHLSDEGQVAVRCNGLEHFPLLWNHSVSAEDSFDILSLLLSIANARCDLTGFVPGDKQMVTSSMMPLAYMESKLQSPRCAAVAGKSQKQCKRHVWKECSEEKRACYGHCKCAR